LRLASRLKKFGRVAKSMNLSESSLPVFGPLRETPNDALSF